MQAEGETCLIIVRKIAQLLILHSQKQSYSLNLKQEEGRQGKKSPSLSQLSDQMSNQFKSRHIPKALLPKLSGASKGAAPQMRGGGRLGDFTPHSTAQLILEFGSACPAFLPYFELIPVIIFKRPASF